MTNQIKITIEKTKEDLYQGYLYINIITKVEIGRPSKFYESCLEDMEEFTKTFNKIVADDVHVDIQLYTFLETIIQDLLR